MKYKLTSQQKDLIIKLVLGNRNNQWGETFLDSSAGGKFDLLAYPGKINIPIVSLSDMDVIASKGLAIREFIKGGTKKYTLLQEAFDAVDNDFEIPDDITHSQVGVQINGPVGSCNIQGIGYSENSQIQQIVNDPEKLKIEVENITNELLSIVKDYLEHDRLINYEKIIQELKNELQKEKIQDTKFRKIISGLSLMNDTLASFDLISKVLPYIILITQIVVTLLNK